MSRENSIDCHVDRGIKSIFLPDRITASMIITSVLEIVERDIHKKVAIPQADESTKD